MRRGPLPAVTAALLLGLGLAVLPADAADQSVSATPSDTFSPAAVTVTQGDTVTWTNAGGNHNVHFEDGSFDRPPSASTSSWTESREFDAVGTFAYYCEVHEDEGMTGTVTVVAAGTTNTPPPPPGGGGPTPGGPSPGGPTPDETRPAVSRLDKGKRAFSFRLSERATVRIVIARAVKRHGKTGYAAKGTLVRRGLAAGKRSIGFRGRLAGKTLAAGRYRATVTATDAAGNRSAPRRIGFRIRAR
jgi:plastocyanin